MVRKLRVRFTFGFWIAGWAGAGLLIPIAALTYFSLFHAGAGDGLLAVWPSSIFLMALDSPRPLPLWTVAPVMTVSVLGNVFIYSAVGSILWLPVSQHP